MIVNNILETIGNTPVLKLNSLFNNDKADVYMKLERFNPGGSIKDRIALSMIEEAEKKGLLQPDSVIVEPTSGNTGIGLALVGAAKGYKVVLVMPESMSIERRKLMEVYGATFELTPRELGMKGAIAKAQEIIDSNSKAWMPQQFNNPANPLIHAETTAQEILKDFPYGLDYVITGVGTGGHISAIGRVLKTKFPNIKIIAVEPELSPVLSGGNPGPHPLQGIGAGFVPGVYDANVIDQIITVSKDDAFEYTRQLAKKESVLGGISTGASLAAIAQKISTLESKAKILTINYDTGERYLSVDGLF
jgi:cysteine synthase A